MVNEGRTLPTNHVAAFITTLARLRNTIHKIELLTRELQFLHSLAVFKKLTDGCRDSEFEVLGAPFDDLRPITRRTSSTTDDFFDNALFGRSIESQAKTTPSTTEPNLL